jgi:HK97 family phage portal protein
VSFLFGRPERRSVNFVSPPIPPNSQAGTLGSTYARVDLSSTEASLQKIAVWACVNLTATIAETMPLDVFAAPGKERPMPSWMADLGGDGHGLPDWLYQYVWSAMLRGNDYGLVAARDSRMGTPTQIALQHPDDVRLRIDSDGLPEWRVSGQVVPREKMWHRRVHPAPGRILGLSPIGLQATTISTGIAAMRFGAQWFQEGAHPSSLLTTGAKLAPGDADTAKDRFMAAVYGRREPVVLGGDWKWQQISIAPNESQFLETNEFTSAECCRIFGPGFAEIFGYQTGGSLTYSNIEQRGLDLLTYAVNPWLVRIENALSTLLPRPHFVKFNRAALVRTDLLTRYRAHEIALHNRWTTVNDVRAQEEQPPVPWGDEPNDPAAGKVPAPPEPAKEGQQ